MISKILLAHLLFVTLLWIISLVRKDASIVDRFWGLFYVFLAFLYLPGGDDPVNWRTGLVLTLVTIWGFRLSVHIHLRNRHHGEDIRYQKMRLRHKKRFWWYSFFSVFIFQGLLSLVISAPLFFAISEESFEAFSLFDAAGLLFWLTGFIFEAGSDWQLKRFKNAPKHKGKLLTTGFWSLCRHPNYFGDACLWWGFYLFALNSEWGWVTVFSPVIMSYFLRYVSGVTLLEKDLIKTKPEYKSYILNTPAFIPNPFRRFSKESR